MAGQANAVLTSSHHHISITVKFWNNLENHPKISQSSYNEGQEAAVRLVGGVET